MRTRYSWRPVPWRARLTSRATPNRRRGPQRGRRGQSCLQLESFITAHPSSVCLRDPPARPPCLATKVRPPKSQSQCIPPPIRKLHAAECLRLPPQSLDQAVSLPEISAFALPDALRSIVHRKPSRNISHTSQLSMASLPTKPSRKRLAAAPTSPPSTLPSSSWTPPTPHTPATTRTPSPRPPTSSASSPCTATPS